jgi:hypothetical protein
MCIRSISGILLLIFSSAENPGHALKYKPTLKFEIYQFFKKMLLQSVGPEAAAP